ncbi:MAG: hypothetical protein KHZ79_07320, partial [Atopobium minutum]|uniref:hypothetical protein n=1 Tax=Atopobium minutum TaxID=1381 RepID=UPI001DC65218
GTPIRTGGQGFAVRKYTFYSHFAPMFTSYFNKRVYHISVYFIHFTTLYNTFSVKLRNEMLAFEPYLS